MCAGLAAWLPPIMPLVTSDLPMKVAPSSITRRAAFKSPCKVQLRFQLAAFAHGDVALHFAVNRDRFGFDLAADIRVLANGQHAIGIDFAFDFPVDEKFLLKFDRAFDFDIARKNVFARMFCHMFLDDRLMLMFLVVRGRRPIVFLNSRI